MTTDSRLRRGTRRNPFTALPNSTLQDARLGTDSLGVLVYLLSLPDDWKFSIKSLARHFSMEDKASKDLTPLPHGKKSGQDAIKRILRCLREAGYITLERTNDGFVVYYTYETPSDNPDPEYPELANPSGSSTTPRVDNPPAPRVDNPPAPRVDNPQGGKSTHITKEIDLSTNEIHTKAGAGFSDDSANAGMTIVDRLIDAIEAGRGAIVKGEMRQMGVLLPWRLNSKNSNSASNFDPRLVARTLKHLRGTSSGSSANLGSAAMWIANRETDADGLRAINTFWEEAQLESEKKADDIASKQKPKPQPSPPEVQSVARLAAKAASGRPAQDLLLAIENALSSGHETRLRELAKTYPLILDYLPGNAA